MNNYQLKNMCKRNKFRTNQYNKKLISRKNKNKIINKM